MKDNSWVNDKETTDVEQWIDGGDFLDQQRAEEQFARAKEDSRLRKEELRQEKIIDTIDHPSQSR